MKIGEFLAASDVAIDYRATSKAELLRDLAARAASDVGLAADVVREALMQREALGPTGIGRGVGLPHARLRELAKPFGLLVRLKPPIAFEAIDGEPVDLVFLLLLPAASQPEQLNVLAAASRKLRDADTVKRLRKATTATEFYRAIAG